MVIPFRIGSQESKFQQPKPLADGRDLRFFLCEPTQFPVCIRTSIPAYQALMVGLSIKSQGWRWAKIDCFDDQFERKNTWIKESFAAVEDVGWRICRDVIIYIYICTSEDQTIISHAHGIVGKFRWLCPSAGWRSAMCLVRWSVAFSEWWD